MKESEEVGDTEKAAFRLKESVDSGAIGKEMQVAGDKSGARA
jgi:hypothetical protein